VITLSCLAGILYGIFLIYPLFIAASQILSCSAKVMSEGLERRAAAGEEVDFLPTLVIVPNNIISQVYSEAVAYFNPLLDVTTLPRRRP